MLVFKGFAVYVFWRIVCKGLGFRLLELMIQLLGFKAWRVGSCVWRRVSYGR